MQDNAKNYQLWNHRRKCAFALGRTAADRELEVAAEALEADDKNYHAWAHRQAVVLVSRLTGAHVSDDFVVQPSKLHTDYIARNLDLFLRGYFSGVLYDLGVYCSRQTDLDIEMLLLLY